MIGELIKLYFTDHYKRVKFMMEHPYQVQQKVFSQLIKTAKDTEWGRRYDYSSVKNHEVYKNRIPVNEYEGIKQYIIRLRQGEQSLLWPTDIKWFAKSSGTTSDKSKFIPVSEESLYENHFRGGIDVYSIYVHNYPDTKMFRGKCLGVGGSHQINTFNANSRYGDISAILVQNMPWWAETLRAPRKEITLMDEWISKVEKMARDTMNENITSFTGVPSWTLVILKKVLELSGKKNIKDVWPALELFVHGAVSFTPYKNQYETLIPDRAMHYQETYNASEGFFAIQDQPGSEDMLLLLDHGVYYEFLPLNELGKENPTAVSLEDVIAGVNYALIISTSGGLWRYMIGDTVTFTSLDPFRIRITGRTRHFINAFGEELIIDNADKAMAEAGRVTGALVREYTAAPVYMNEREAGGHEWLIEFETPPLELEKFIDTLDNTLKALNSDYEAKRYKNMAIRRPVVRILPDGTFHEWLKAKGKLGGQHKVPRLSNDRFYVEEILKQR